MATKIRGITIELGADTSGIEKGLKDVNKDLKATQNELKDVDKLLKLDPKNTELLRQKQELLGKAIGQTKEKLETLKKAEQEAENQFKQGKISEDQYRAIKREVAETEGNLKKLGDEAQTANKKLSNVPETMNKIADKAKTAAQKTRGISLAAAGILTALGAGVLNTVRNADDITSTAKKSGISTDRIQEYRYAADLIDVSADAIISANTKLKKNMASGGAAFDKLGVKVTDANGELRDSSEVFDEVVLALSKIQNETERDTVAMEIFGKGADELAGLIDDGGAAFRELAKEAHEAGAVLSQDSLNALNKTNDALDKLKAKGSAALGQVAEKLINNPKFDAFLDKTTEFLDQFVGAIAEMPLEKIETLVGILAGTAAISPLATLIGNVAGAIGDVTKAISGMKAGNLATAIGSGSSGLVGALGALAIPLAALAIAEGLKIEVGGDTFDAQAYMDAEKRAAEIKAKTGIDVPDMLIYDNPEAFADEVLDELEKKASGTNGQSALQKLAEAGAWSPWGNTTYDAKTALANDQFRASMTNIPVVGGALAELVTGSNSATPTTITGSSGEGGGDQVVVNVVYKADAAAIGQALEPSITAERQRRGASAFTDRALGLTW